MELKIKRLRDGAKMPFYATDGSAACDLYSLLDEPAVLQPGERRLIPTGLAIALPDRNCVALICARSGLAYKRGLGLCNGIGVIDSDYRGELMVAVINNDPNVQIIENGERVGQLMIVPVILPLLTECKELDETERGTGGFGSTGIK